MARGILVGLGIAAATAACLSGARGAHAQAADDVTIEIGPCVDLKSPEERRACYGARVDAAVQDRERGAGQPAPPSPASAPASPASAPQSSSPNAAADTFRPTRSAPADAEDRPAVVATIAALRETVPNTYLITLDNDQVWRQTRSKWHPLRVGHTVRIYSTNWGDSYRLVVDGLSGYLQVERVR